MKKLALENLSIGLAACCVFAASPASFAGEGSLDGMIRMMDTDGDGKISLEEHAAGTKKMFEMMDGDKDGKVTATEMDAAHGKMGKMMGKKPAKTDMSSADMIKICDANNDGALMTEEHVLCGKKMFEKMDADKDGSLTKAELTAGHAKMMQKPAK